MLSSVLKLSFLIICAYVTSAAVGDTAVGYYVANRRVGWGEAGKICQEASMKLVSIQTKAKNDAINNFIEAAGLNKSGDGIWTSGNKKQADTNWIWGTGEIATFFNWDVGEPNNNRGDLECISIYRSKGATYWDDVPCEASDVQYYPLCENTVSCPNQGAASKCPPTIINVQCPKRIISLP